MLFLYPSLLWALFAILVPIIIHLFNFKKYKIVYFTNVRFLKDLQQKSKAKSRLKEILVLIARCLAIACLVLAFCQPILPNDSGDENKDVSKAISIYIDNSFSTQNINKQGEVLELSKMKAKDLLKSLSNQDKVQVITNDFEGKHQRLNTKQDAINLIDEIKPSAAVKSINQVLKRQSEFLRNSSQAIKQIFVFSDIQKSTFDLDQYKVDSTFKIYILPILPNLVNNIYIDSCWFETPFQQYGFIQKLHARVVNKGTKDLELLSAQLKINEQQTAISSFSVLAHSQTEIKFTFNSKQKGFNYCEIKIEDYPITFDDKLFFAFNASNQIVVSMINGKNARNRLNNLFLNDSLFSLKESNELSIDYASFKASDLLVLNELTEMSSGLIAEIIEFTKKGGNILIVPNIEGNLTNYTNAFNLLNLPSILGVDTSVLSMQEIDQSLKFYEGVFESRNEKINLPKVNKHYLTNADKRLDFEKILTLQNGDFLLGSVNMDQSKIFLFSSSLEKESNNFYNHALLVPTIYKIAFESVKQTKLHLTLNSNDIIEIKSKPEYLDEPFKIVNVATQNDFIPESRLTSNKFTLYFQHQPEQVGFYTMKHKNDSLMPMAFNYSRLESDLTNYSIEELQKIIDLNKLSNVTILNYLDAKTGEISQLINGGKQLWKLFLILALAFLLIEIALLRFIK